MGSYKLPIDTCGLSLTIFELFRWLEKRFRPSDPDTVTNTARSRSYRFVERKKSNQERPQIVRQGETQCGQNDDVADFGATP